MKKIICWAVILVLLVLVLAVPAFAAPPGSYCGPWDWDYFGYPGHWYWQYFQWCQGANGWYQNWGYWEWSS